MSVLAYVENWDGKFKKLSFELLSYAAKVAEQLNTDAIALSIGEVEEDELRKLGKYGVKKIYSYTDENLKVFDTRSFTSVISDFAGKENATVVLLANNNTGKAIAPGLCVRLKAGIGAGVSKLPVSIDPFVVYKKVFSGNAFANVMIKTPIRILTLSQNSFEVIETADNSTIEKVAGGVHPGSIKTELKEVQKQSGKILLTDAEIVVSGGRGMKSPD
ncbi:MAG: electron transfer flavoprotein subunit alpha/FixB family protein, partial [Bacteroidota bacterium]